MVSDKKGVSWDSDHILPEGNEQILLVMENIEK